MCAHVRCLSADNRKCVSFIPDVTIDMNLENQKDRGRSCSVDKQHLKTLVEQNPHQSVRETSQIT